MTGSGPSAPTRSSPNKGADVATAVGGGALRPRSAAIVALRRNGAYLAGLTPAAFLLALFFVGPSLWALYTSFTNKALVGLDAARPRFVGLENYQRLLSDPDFATVVINSIVFVVGSAIIGQFVLGLLLALLLDHAERRRYRFATVAYAAVLLAWVNPTVIAGFLWVAMYDFYYGSLNTGLQALGFRPVDWLRPLSHPPVVLRNIL